MSIELDESATAAPSGKGWIDSHGFQGPMKPGEGPRRDPLGSFPTGPELGSVLPDVIALDAAGNTIDVHQDRRDRRAIVIFNRSVVW